jgi:hypothetical protein
MVADHYREKWPQDYPWTVTPHTIPPSAPTQAEFDRLKAEVDNLKKLLERAKEYDKKNNEPDCEIEDKVKFLKKVAESVGVDLEEVFKKDV